MKQHITLEQFFELGEREQDKIIEWNETKNRDGSFPYFTIGQMIEFLDEHSPDKRYKSNKPLDWYQQRRVTDDSEAQWWWIIPEHLCDDLWEAVKEKLEKKQ